MGLADRDYLRDPRAGGRAPARAGLGGLRFLAFNTWLIIINIAVFLLGAVVLVAPAAQRPVFLNPVFLQDTTDQQAQHGYAYTLAQLRAAASANRADFHRAYWPQRRAPIVLPGAPPQQIGEVLVVLVPLSDYWGQFSTDRAFFGLEVWRFVTFQFLHAGPMHLLFNMLGLWFVGGLVEQYLGSKRYAAYYLICGVFGALMYLVLNFLGAYVGVRLPGVLIHDPATPLVGASAGIFGVLVAAAYIAPNSIVLIFGILPMKMRTAVYAFIGIAAISLIAGSSNAGGEAAHLGGAIAGYFFIRRTHLLRDFFEIFGRAAARIPAAPGTRPRAAHPPPRGEIDRILAKVATQGLHSLSPGERDTLRYETDLRRGGSP